MRDTLLVIDEAPLDLAILREIFKQLFHVECFEETRPAIAYCHRNLSNICAVLLGVRLGKKKGGLQVLQQLQTAEETSSLPVILLASNAKEEDVFSAVEKGAADFLIKPVNPITVQERVCAAVQAAWPAGSTILDGKLSMEMLDTQAPSPEEVPFLAAEHWKRLLELFFLNRPHFSFTKYHILGRVTAALAKGYRKVVPDCTLTDEDVQLIGRAAVFCDVGLLGIPDNVIEQGQDQGGAGQELYFRHTALGHALFTTGIAIPQPLAGYAAEIAYWHHKNYDGTGYPAEQTPTPIPISAQFVRAAIRCLGYMDYYHGYPDRLDRILRSLASDVGRYISPEVYEAAMAVQDELADCLSSDRLG